MNSTFVFVQADMEIFLYDALCQNIESSQPQNRLYQDLCFKATAHLIQCLSDFRDMFSRLTLNLSLPICRSSRALPSRTCFEFFTLGLLLITEFL